MRTTREFKGEYGSMSYRELSNNYSEELYLSGKLDVNSESGLIKLVLNALIREVDLIIDLSDVVYLSSAGLRALFVGEKASKAKGIKMTVLKPQPQVRQVLEITGMDNVLSIQNAA